MPPYRRYLGQSNAATPTQYDLGTGRGREHVLTSDINDAAMRMSFEDSWPVVAGGPTVQIPTQPRTASTPNYGLPTQSGPPDPSFWGAATGPTVETPRDPLAGLVDQWWLNTQFAGSPAATATPAPTASSGGDIWSEPMIPSGGGRSPTFVDDTGLDWTGTEPATAAPSGGGRSPGPLDITDPWTGVAPETAIPPAVPGNPPGPIDVTDPWTGQTPRRGDYTGPGNIGTFGNNLTFGEFLNTPLANMHYGEGYPPVSGGDIITGEGNTRSIQHVGGDSGGGPEPTTGAVQIDPSTGQPYDFNSIPGATVTMDDHEVRRGELVTDPTSTPGKSRAELSYEQSQAYRDAQNFGTDTHHNFTGFDPNLLMGNQLAGDTTNQAGGDMPQTRASYGQFGHLDEFGGFVQTGAISGNARSRPSRTRQFIYGSQGRGG